MELETKVYQKENNLRLGRLLKDSLSDLISSRFLARQLAFRDIKAQYRQSFLGIFWAFASPLATAFVWIFLNSSGTIRLSDTGIPYPVYAFTGTLLWSIITESINSPISSTNASKSIISKINFPKEALIVSGIYKLLFNTSIKVILLFFFLVFFGIGFHWSLLWLPLVILGAILFGTTIGLLLTPIGLLYKDIGKMISFGLQFLMYASPVVYAIPKDGIMKLVMEYNPLTPIILTARDVAVGMTPEFIGYFLIVIGTCIPLLFLALVIYRISIPVIVERLSA
jgi:lipopolysaccharide transport system permease protein